MKRLSTEAFTMLLLAERDTAEGLCGEACGQCQGCVAAVKIEAEAKRARESESNLLEALRAIIATADAPLRPSTMIRGVVEFVPNSGGTGECSKHGRVYGSCASCAEVEQRDLDNRVALKSGDTWCAIESARRVIAKAEGR